MQKSLSADPSSIDLTLVVELAYLLVVHPDSRIVFGDKIIDNLAVKVLSMKNCHD